MWSIPGQVYWAILISRCLNRCHTIQHAIETLLRNSVVECEYFNSQKTAGHGTRDHRQSQTVCTRFQDVQSDSDGNQILCTATEATPLGPGVVQREIGPGCRWKSAGLRWHRSGHRRRPLQLQRKRRVSTSYSCRQCGMLRTALVLTLFQASRVVLVCLEAVCWALFGSAQETGVTRLLDWSFE